MEDARRPSVVSFANTSGSTLPKLSAAGTPYVPGAAEAEGVSGGSTGTLEGDAEAAAPSVTLGVREGEGEGWLVPVGELEGVAP